MVHVCSNFARTQHFLLQAWQAIYEAAFNPEQLTPKDLHIEDKEVQNLLKSEILLQNKNINKIFKTNMCKKSMSDETRKFWLGLLLLHTCSTNRVK